MKHFIFIISLIVSANSYAFGPALYQQAAYLNALQIVNNVNTNGVIQDAKPVKAVDKPEYVRYAQRVSEYKKSTNEYGHTNR